jgi:hypothetical protein
MPADEDAEAGAGAAARLFGQLESHAIGAGSAGGRPNSSLKAGRKRSRR